MDLHATFEIATRLVNCGPMLLLCYLTVYGSACLVWVLVVNISISRLNASLGLLVLGGWAEL